jgi:hypothetical protein
MADIFTGATGKEAAAESGYHAEILSDGKGAVLSLLNLTTQVWSMAILENASELASNTACMAFAIKAAATPDQYGAVTEDENEDYFDKCLDLEDKLKASIPRGEDDLDVDEEPDDEDNDFL